MSDQPTLKQAMILVSRRKLAVASKIGSETGIVVSSDIDSARQILLGTDLTVEEVREAVSNAIKPAMIALIFEDSVGVDDALAGCFVDGLLAGLVLADLRAKASLHEEQQMRAEESAMKKRSGGAS